MTNKEQETKRLIIRSIANTTTLNDEVVMELIQSSSRNKENVKLRHIFRFLLKSNTNLSLKAVGQETLSDHSTVIHSIREVENSLILSFKDDNKDFYHAVIQEHKKIEIDQTRTVEEDLVYLKQQVMILYQKISEIEDKM